MTMKFCVHMFVLVCAVTYVKCATTAISTKMTKSTTQTTTPASKPIVNVVTNASPATTNSAPATTKHSPGKSSPPQLHSSTTVEQPTSSSDSGPGNGSHQPTKPWNPLIFGTIAVWFYFT